MAVAGFTVPPAWQLPTGVPWKATPGFDSIGSISSYPSAPSSVSVSNPAGFGSGSMALEYNPSGIMQFKSNDMTVWPVSIAMPMGSAITILNTGKDMITFFRTPKGGSTGMGSIQSQSHLMNYHEPQEPFSWSALNRLLYSPEGRRQYGVNKDFKAVYDDFHLGGVQQHAVPPQREDQTEYRGNYIVEGRCRIPLLHAKLGKRPHKLDSLWILARRYEYIPYATKVLDELKLQHVAHPMQPGVLSDKERKYLQEQKRSVASAQQQLQNALADKGSMMEIDPTFQSPLDRAFLDASTGRMTGLRPSRADAKEEHYWQLDPWMGGRLDTPPEQLYIPADRSFIGHAYRLGIVTQLFGQVDDLQGNARFADTALYPRTETPAYKEAVVKLPQAEVMFRVE